MAKRSPNKPQKPITVTIYLPSAYPGPRKEGLVSHSRLGATKFKTSKLHKPGYDVGSHLDIFRLLLCLSCAVTAACLMYYSNRSLVFHAFGLNCLRVFPFVIFNVQTTSKSAHDPNLILVIYYSRWPLSAVCRRFDPEHSLQLAG